MPPIVDTFIFNIKNLLKNSTKHKACMESNIGTKETLKEGNKIATNIVPHLLARQRPLEQK